MIKLVCVNLQNDFLENGAFPIKGFRDVVDKIVRLISATNESRMNSSRVMLVDSFHPENHFLFYATVENFQVIVFKTLMDKIHAWQNTKILTLGFMKKPSWELILKMRMFMN